MSKMSDKRLEKNQSSDQSHQTGSSVRETSETQLKLNPALVWCDAPDGGDVSRRPAADKSLRYSENMQISAGGSR